MNEKSKQKKVWEDIGRFNSYLEAKEKCLSTERETKIRRCGPNGTKFKVKAVKKYLEPKD